MRTVPTVLAALFAASVAHPVAWAAEYYASPTGSGNTCSESSPCSIGTAVGMPGAGDTVYLMDGEYEAPSYGIGIGASGSAGSWVTIQAAPGAVPIIQGPESGNTTGVNVSGTYIRIEGIVSRGFASGFANQWGGPNGNLEFINCVAEDLGRNGIAFYDAAGVLVEGCIVAHTGHTEGWSSGVNMFGASQAIVRRTVSFETIDASGEGTDGSGFIADQNSSGVVFENNIGFRNGGSCIRLTNSPGSQIINNTCVHNGLDPNVNYHDEIFFSQAAARTDALLRNNLCIPTQGQQGLTMGDGVPDENNIWDGTDDLVVSASGDLDFNLSSSATAAIDQGTSTGAPSDDIGFDWRCIKQQSGQRYDWWQYMPDYEYMRTIGGVAACFNAGARSGNPDIGAHESGAAPVGTGGAPGTGGVASTGGAADTGGATSSGGATTVSTGGAANTGGVRSTGGAGTVSTGGAANTGGVTSTGGATTVSTGGAADTGGATSTGGQSTTVDGGCAAGLTACGTLCVDLATDVAHCGACDAACAAGDQCVAGVCTAVCQAPLVECGSACVDFSTDAANCGSCGAACAAGQVCSAGLCTSTCPAGTTQCGQGCVDLSTSLLNCGACDTPCLSGQTCQSGQCVGTATGGDVTEPATPTTATPTTGTPSDSATAADDAAGPGKTAPVVVEDEGGCGCSTVGPPRTRFGVTWTALLGLLALVRRGRGRRRGW